MLSKTIYQLLAVELLLQSLSSHYVAHNTTACLNVAYSKSCKLKMLLEQAEKKYLFAFAAIELNTPCSALCKQIANSSQIAASFQQLPTNLVECVRFAAEM